MPKYKTKYRKHYSEALATGHNHDNTEYRFAIQGYGRIVWATIITLSVIVFCISAASGDGHHAW